MDPVSIGMARRGMVRGVAQSTAPDPSVGVWIDTSSVVPGPLKFKRVAFTAGSTGSVDTVLDYVPATDSVMVYQAGLLIAHTLVGQTVTASLTSGSSVVIHYAYNSTASDPVLVAQDSFDRANSTTSLGTADLGGVWVPNSVTSPGNTFGITSNQAYLATTGGNNRIATLDPGVADVRVRVKIATVVAGVGPGLCLRAVDGDNCFTTNDTALYKREAGTNTQILAFGVTIASGDSIEIRCKGSTFTAWRQPGSTGSWVQMGGSATNTFNQTATKHGIRCRQTGGRLDDFQIVTNP